MTGPADTSHECPGPGCKARVPVDMLACKRHWYQVTAGTRARVWRTYRQQAGGPAHMAAMAQAVREMRT